MKKLLGMFICGCVALVLSFGSAGCTKDTKTKTPTVTLTPTVTMTPTVTLTPTVTMTPTVKTPTPTPKPTPTVTPTPTPTPTPKPTPTPTPTPTEKTPKTDLKVEPKVKAEVKIKAADAEIDVAKKGDTKVTVELTEPAPENLTLKAWAKGVDAKVLTGTGTIKKGETSGEVTITTVDAPATVSEITVDIAATGASKASSTTLKTKVK